MVKQTIPQFSTVDNRRTPKPSQTRQTSRNNEETRAASGNNNKLRTIIFKTLDRLFQIKPLPSKTVQSTVNRSPQNTNDTLTLETLKLLNQNAEDTLPRDRRTLPFHEHQALLADSLAQNEHEKFCDESSSDDDSCWEFITPLKFEEVALDDSLKPPVAKNASTGKENVSISTENPKRKTQQSRYQRQNKRGSEKTKIQKRALERQNEKMKNEMRKLEKTPSPQQIRNRSTVNAYKVREDSPIQKRKSIETNISSARSLPNLIEAIQELDLGSTSTLSECGSDTFARNISYCPSSTLCKNIPSFSENHENEDDACSTSSSFSSLQMMQGYSSVARSTHESTLPIPSALCSDVLITPINVPIQPFKQNDKNEKTAGITSHGFKELSEVYLPNNARQTINEPAAQEAKANRTSSFKKHASSPAEDDSMPQDVRNSQPCDIIPEEGLIISLFPNASLPPAPPPFPPPPPPPTATNTTIRGLLPLPIFTQRQAGNCIFNEMKDIRIEDGDVRKLKEKFPLKTGSAALKRLFGREKTQEFSPEEKKFLRLIEMFLKTYRIPNESAPQVIDSIIRSILTLNTENSEVEAEWFATLAQFLPKEEEISKMRRNKKLQSTDIKSVAESFVSELLKVNNLHGKLICIQFSLDFTDGSSKLDKWAESFIETCNAIKMSEKFVSIINVIMRLLQTLNPDDHSTIYGFDIQGLTRLATKKAEDGSLTFLQFVIEYILGRPDLADSIDFYETFKDIPDVTKTSIQEMRAQCEEWKRSLLMYKSQVEQIQNDHRAASCDLQHATKFIVSTERRLQQLNEKLDEAQQTFNSCKERFGLMNSETTEIFFFESLSKFVLAYQKTYNEVIAQKGKVSKKNVTNVNARSNLVTPPRDSKDPVTPKEVFRESSTGTEILDSRDTPDGLVRRLKPSVSNLQRKSYASRKSLETPIVTSPETEELGLSLQNILTDNGQGRLRGNRLRKRCSNSPSKLLLRI